MTGTLIALAVLTAVLYVALRRARINDPIPRGLLFSTVTGTLMLSRHVPPGQVYLVGRVPFDWIDLHIDVDRRLLRASAEIRLVQVDPTPVVRITGV